MHGEGFTACHGFVPDRRPHSVNRSFFLTKVTRALEQRPLPRGFRQVSVLSFCEIFRALGRALKTTNPAALAPFAAGFPGAGLDGAVITANWLDLRHRASLTHGWPRIASRVVGRACANVRTSLPSDASGRPITA